jgi:hypothetical protein
MTGHGLGSMRQLLDSNESAAQALHKHAHLTISDAQQCTCCSTSEHARHNTYVEQKAGCSSDCFVSNSNITSRELLKQCGYMRSCQQMSMMSKPNHDSNTQIETCGWYKASLHNHSTPVLAWLLLP